MTVGSTLPETFHVLCVCTGNVYRSRIAAEEFRGQLHARLGAEAERFVVSSAGTRAATAAPLETSYVDRLEALGVPSGGAVTRRLDVPAIKAADLVLTAEVRHRTAVLELAPGALRRTFVLRELARVTSSPRLGRMGSTATSAGGDAITHARAVVAAASTHRAAVAAPDGDDIEDPWGAPSATLDLVARQVRDAVTRVLDALVGPVDGVLR